MRRSALAMGILLTLVVAPKPALSWGSAVHAYIGARLGDRGLQQKDMIYGGVAADAFNFLFEEPEAMRYLYGVTHGLTPYGVNTVEALLGAAETKREYTFALGVVSHNNVTAADTTAHGNPYNSPDGYVIAKALVLMDILEPSLTAAGLTLPGDVFLEVSHVLVEYAAELLIREADRSIGATIVSAAAVRDDRFPELLADVYAPGLAYFLGMAPEDARALIVDQEEEFRSMMLTYGTILQKGDEKALEALEQFIAAVAKGYLAMYGLEVPDAYLNPLIHGGILAALELCRGDLMPAVEDTIDLVAQVIAPLR